MYVYLIIRCMKFTFTFTFFLKNKVALKGISVYNKNRNVQCSHLIYEKLFINFSCCFKILFHLFSFLLVFPVIYVCIQKVISVC
jgi:hypothetical protein